MNVLMMTNTYLPSVCGVTRSVVTFSEALRARGHRVLVVAPAAEDDDAAEEDVVRVPALHHVTGNDIPVRLPIPGYLTSTLTRFQPDIVHAHHPFLMGSTALRVASSRQLPVVFTHHTMYEHYTRYIPGDSTRLERFTIRLATDFANLCDHVVAPSQSVADVLRERGVEAPLSVVPTGIDPQSFNQGDGPRSRQRHGIPPQAFVVGHVGRLAAEKNLEFLALAVCKFLRQREDARFFVVGSGPMRDEIERICAAEGLSQRLHLSDGELTDQDLADAYAAMNVLAFSSHSETQGMVLAEAMTAGLPVVALDASGARDIVRDRVNGRLLEAENPRQFAAALAWAERGASDERVQRGIRRTAAEFSMDRTVEKLEEVYDTAARHTGRDVGDDTLSLLLARVNEEYQLWSRIGHALYDATFGETDDAPRSKAG